MIVPLGHFVRVAEVRLRNKWTVQDLCREMGITQTQWVHARQGEPVQVEVAAAFAAWSRNVVLPWEPGGSEWRDGRSRGRSC